MIIQVKYHKTNSQAGFIKIIILVVLLILVALVVSSFIYWAPEKSVRRKQMALYKAVESKNPARVMRLLSDNYRDRWGFTPKDISESILDARKQFVVMSVQRDETQEVYQIEGSRAIVTTRIRIGGTPSGPAGASVKQQVNRLNKPFIFTWRKESFLPSSWRLVSLENETIPDDVWGYTPGQLSRISESMDGKGIEEMLDSLGE